MKKTPQMAETLHSVQETPGSSGTLRSLAAKFHAVPPTEKGNAADFRHVTQFSFLIKFFQFQF